jgi:hypothetical protein
MSTKTLVVIVGPPAVGKMTVGRALERLTGLPLFHNNMLFEAVLPFFPIGSEPFTRLFVGFRQRLLVEVAASERPGMIFTYAWAFDDPSARRFIDGLRAVFAAKDGRTVFVELWTDLDTRLRRNTSELRLAEKVSKRDLPASERHLLALERQYQLSSDGSFPFPEYLRIDNTEMSPELAAARIATHFGLPTLPAPIAPAAPSKATGGELAQ